MLPPTIFFVVAFNVVSITKALMPQQYGIAFSGFAMATVRDLLVGTVVLVADKFPLINKFPERPLIYNVPWKILVYVAAVFLVRYVKHMIPFIRESGGLGVAYQHLLDEVI